MVVALATQLLFDFFIDLIRDLHVELIFEGFSNLSQSYEAVPILVNGLEELSERIFFMP